MIQDPPTVFNNRCWFDKKNSGRRRCTKCVAGWKATKAEHEPCVASAAATSSRLARSTTAAVEAPAAAPQARQGRVSPHDERPGYRVHAQTRAPGAERWSSLTDDHSLQWDNQTTTRQLYRL